MSIPTYQDLMLPLLEVLAEHDCLRVADAAHTIADRLKLSSADREAILPSGGQLYVVNRTGWAGWYMMQAGLVSRPKRAHFAITDEGRRLLATKPAKIDNQMLARYPAFVEKIGKGKPTSSSGEEAEGSGAVEEKSTPTERMESAYVELRRTLENDLLDQLHKVNPFRFEQVVLDLLVAMGYGGSRAEAAQVTQKTGDEGIDGVINEDRLGLDVIYVQAKRWQSKVGRPEIQSFVGALAGKKASKGIFITTSDFHANAREYAAGLHQKVILIDGRRLAELMIDHNIGVAEEQVYRLKRIDSDYFLEDAI